MPKQTLLSLTQDILSAIDGDEVNSLSDTVEAMQVATLIKRCYLDIVTELDLPVNRTLRSLNGLGDTNRPSHMEIPEAVSKIYWIQYDVRLDVADPITYRDIKRMEPHDFIHFVNTRPSDDTTNFVVVTENGRPLVIDKTVGPSYWTSFDDEFIVFDAYDANVDSTLQTTKSSVYVDEAPAFTIDDDFIPDLPENLFPYLYNKAEANAFAKQKQEVNPKAEQSENRLRIRSQRNKWRQDRLNISGPNYGRR